MQIKTYVYVNLKIRSSYYSYNINKYFINEGDTLFQNLLGKITFKCVVTAVTLGRQSPKDTRRITELKIS